MKHELNLICGIFGAIISYAFGAFSLALQILLYLMLLDYITGVIAAACHSQLSSKAGYKGIFKKLLMLIVCSVAYKIDVLMNAGNLLASGAIIFYCSNEAISIVENAIEMGLPVPEKLKDAINIILHDEEDKI